jgi:signal transduction histidine kinase/CheY-like chemotaxis protein
MFPRKNHFTEINPPLLRAAYDAVVLEGLPPVTTGFSLLYAVFAVGHLVLLPPALARPLTITAVAVVLLFLLLRYLVSTGRITLRWAHPAATAMSLVVMLSILQHIHLSGEPRQTTNLMLLIVGAGFFLLASHWFLFFLLVAIVSWTLLAYLSAATSEWMHYSFGMLTATVLSSVGHIARRRTLRRIEVLRARERAQRREIEQARDSALEATRLKSEFLTNISHEIRTPMHGILGMTNLLRDTTLDRKQRGFADAIRSCGDFLLSLINDLLDLSKIEAGKLQPESFDFNLHTLIHETAAMLRPRAEAKGLRFSVEVTHDVPTSVRGDARRIRQVLVNLLGNAIKFTERGAIELRVQASEHPLPETLTNENHVRVRFTIRDTGIGIPLDFQDKLFDPFTQADGSTTRRYGGTGLGLAISKQIIEAMRGEIGVEITRADNVSADDDLIPDNNESVNEILANRGSIFWFALPLELRPSESSKLIMRDESSDSESSDSVELKKSGDAEHAHDGDAFPFSQRILVVDDNRINQQIIAHYVERLGFAVSVASNGIEALAMFAKENFALVLMDCQMPEMDGLRVTREIRRLEESMTNSIARRASIPIIAMTAHAMPHERERCLAAGMNDYLGKPVDDAQLEAAIRRHLAIPARARLTGNPRFSSRQSRVSSARGIRGARNRFDIAASSRFQR